MLSRRVDPVVSYLRHLGLMILETGLNQCRVSLHHVGLGKTIVVDVLSSSSHFVVGLSSSIELPYVDEVKSVCK
jgi:hypothetical protein